MLITEVSCRVCHVDRSCDNMVSHFRPFLKHLSPWMLLSQNCKKHDGRWPIIYKVDSLLTHWQETIFIAPLIYGDYSLFHLLIKGIIFSLSLMVIIFSLSLIYKEDYFLYMKVIIFFLLLMVINFSLSLIYKEDYFLLITNILRIIFSLSHKLSPDALLHV